MKKIKAKELIKYLRTWGGECDAIARESAESGFFLEAYEEKLQEAFIQELIKGIIFDFNLEGFNDE